MHMYYAFGNYIYSFSSMTHNVFLVWQIFIFLYLCQWLLEIVLTCVSLQNTNAHKIMWQLQIFYIWQPYLFFPINDFLNLK